MRIRSSIILLLLLACIFFLCSPVSVLAEELSSESISLPGEINSTAAEVNGTRPRSEKDSFADMIDRALEKEFTENEQSEGPY